MRRRLLLGALFAAFVVAPAITLAIPRMPVAAYATLAAIVCIAPGLVATIRKREARAIVALVVGALASPALVWGAWLFAHPVLHVDDATEQPMQIWIDGAPAMIVAPSSGDEEPPRLRVPWGHRRLGWSDVGAQGPKDEISATIDVTGDILYSPGAAGCYWIEARSYGKASLHEVPHGPQRVAQVLRFDRVDVWFGDNPSTLRRSLLRWGDVSIAVQRWDSCMKLARVGCDAAARQEFVDCQTALHGPAAGGDCYEKTLRACAGEDAK